MSRSPWSEALRVLRIAEGWKLASIAEGLVLFREGLAESASRGANLRARLLRHGARLTRTWLDEQRAEPPDEDRSEEEAHPDQEAHRADGEGFSRALDRIARSMVRRLRRAHWLCRLSECIFPIEAVLCQLLLGQVGILKHRSCFQPSRVRAFPIFHYA